MTQPTLYALLIGINHYASPNVPDLGGSVNDVTAMHQLLTERFGVPPAQIKVLTDEEATLAAIRVAFEQHLIAPARQWGEDGRQGEAPALLFHFSGHGSQAPDPTGTEPDGLDETLVCHDSRLPDHYDLKDWEVGLLLDEAARYTHNITVILDCCHSGSGTRAGEAKAIADTRGCATDLRRQPTGRPSTMQSGAATRSGSAPVSNSWLRGSARHVLLAACRDNEKAHEHHFTLETGAIRHGVLTQTLVHLLTTMADDRPLTYHELYEQVVIGVRQLYRTQNPQCEGDWGRLIFGGIGIDRDLWWRVVAIEGEVIWVEGGAFALTPGDRLAVYPEMARRVAEAGAPLAMLEVVQSEGTRSRCRRVEAGAAIPIHSRVARSSRALGEARRTVALVMGSGMTADALRARLAQADLAGMIELRPATAEADLRLLLTPDAVEIQDGTGQRLFNRYRLTELNRARRPMRADDFNPVAESLKLMVQAQLLALLKSPNSTLAGMIGLAIKGLKQAAVGLQEVALPTTPEGRATLVSGDAFMVEITNGDSRPFYIGLLACWLNGTVEQLYPQVGGAQDSLVGRQTVKAGWSDQPQRQLRLTLPAGQAQEVVTLKLIATRQPTTFDALLQSVDQPTAQPAVYIDPTKQTRRFVLKTQGVTDEWTTAQLTIQLVRPA